jgi:hypothetical protein
MKLTSIIKQFYKSWGRNLAAWRFGLFFFKHFHKMHGLEITSKDGREGFKVKAAQTPEWLGYTVSVAYWESCIEDWGQTLIYVSDEEMCKVKHWDVKL